MTDRPNPLVPPEVDLRDFAFMPLDVARLRDSDLASNETPESCWAAVLLWCASWHQVPAGSVPDSDQWLAKAAGYLARGRIDPAWAKVRIGAMHGWVLCSDGRWYHPTVAEKALEAWRSKQRQRWKTECERIKKHGQRHGMHLPTLDFESWLAAGCPSGHALPVPRDKPPDPGGHASGVPPDTGGGPSDVPGETPSKGQGEGQRQGQLASLAARTHARTSAVDLAVEARRHGVQVTGSDPRLIEAAAQGVSTESLRDAIDDCRRRKGGAPPAIGYVLATLQGWATDAAGLRVVGATAPGARGGATDDEIAALQAKYEAEARNAAA